MLTSRYVIPQHVAFRDFGGETVVLNIKTGAYHRLNPVAGRMLDLLRATGDPQAVVATVTEEYAADPERVRGDVASLCNELLELGLIDRAPEAAG